MAITTLLNPNLDSNGYSDDNFLQHELDMGATLALVRNSPKLVAMNADSRVNIASIYRAAGDGNFSDSPDHFVMSRLNAAPQATWIHLTNEAGLPPEIGAWSLSCASVAEAHGKKVVAFNAATNTDVALWKAQESAIRQLVTRGHRIGIHLYLDGTHDSGGYAPLDWLKSIGAACFITEYGYIKTITHDGEGWRGVMDELAYTDWIAAHAAKLVSYGWPAYLFSIDQWPNNAEGRAKGFGTEDRLKVLQGCKTVNLKYPLGGTMPNPPVYPPGTQPVAAIVNLSGGVNLRSDPVVGAANVVRTMPHGEHVTVYEQPSVPSGIYTMIRVHTATGDGWSAQWINGVDSFVPAPAPPATALQLAFPVDPAIIVQAFGVNHTGIPDFYTQYGLPAHEGVDFKAPTGTNVYACADGHVTRIERQVFEGSGSAYGIQIRIEHVEADAIYETIYAHLQSVPSDLVVGGAVACGQLIGLSDNTGHTTASHLHLSLKKRGATARGETQQLGDGTWVVYPSDLVDPTPFFKP